VASALAAKGVDATLVAATVEELGQGEEQRARHIARSRAGRFASLEPHKAFQRLVGLLMRRGFSPEIARSAARSALDVDASDD
jgi:regulatory protein